MVPLCRIHVTRASSDAMRAISYFITRKGAHVKLPIELHVREGRVKEGGVLPAKAKTTQSASKHGPWVLASGNVSADMSPRV